MKKKNKAFDSRRNFLKTTIKGVAGAATLTSIPSIVPASVFGKYAPSKRINIGVIGTGRISRQWDMPGILKHEQARIIAVCDLDSNRVQSAKKFVEAHYAKQTGGSYSGVKTFEH